MYKKVLSCVGNYKKYAILTPVTIIGEVVMEVLIPTVMALIIDNGIRQGDIGYVVKMGLVMMLMAAVSLCFGAISGRFAAVAGMGFSNVGLGLVHSMAHPLGAVYDTPQRNHSSNRYGI